jgi:hypothetical protein
MFLSVNLLRSLSDHHTEIIETSTGKVMGTEGTKGIVGACPANE